jgi:hypothetical protein
VTSRDLLRWTRLHERRARRSAIGWLLVVLAAAGFALLCRWRLDEVGLVSASKLWLAGALAAFGLAFMRVPFHLYWRADASLLAQLPIGGGPLFDVALVRCVRTAAITGLVVLSGVLPFALLDGELLVRFLAVTATLFVLAAALLPAVAAWAASLVARAGDALELATALGGAPAASRARASVPGSSSAILGALPGFASTVVIVFVIIAAPWLYGRDTALPAPAVLGGLAVASVLALAAMRAAAPRVMGRILRDVSALDRQQLATLEIRPPTALERSIARMLGEASLPYRKDARLMRRRYPMAFALGALAFLVLVIAGLARPADPLTWLVGVVAGMTLYAVVLAGRLGRPPIELPRLSATLPIPPAAIARAKLAWVVGWTTVFLLVPLAFAAVRLL